MDKSKKSKAQKAKAQASVLESLKDIGSSTQKSLKEDILRPEDFIEQIIGSKKPQKVSGEIEIGESLEVSEILSGEYEEKRKLRKQIEFAQRLRVEDKSESEKTIQELRIQLQVITEEVTKLAKETEGLSDEIKTAAFQSPVEPGVYHISFFEGLIKFIRDFRKKISSASNWLHEFNARAQKKNAWGARYKKYGAKYLLSGEHYLTRSAG